MRPAGPEPYHPHQQDRELYHMSSRPPPTRKVISTDRPGPTRSPSAPTGLQKPLKAKVDLSSLGGSSSSSSSSPKPSQFNWAPTTQPHRARVQFANDHSASAPITPTNGLSRGPTRPSSSQSQSSVFPNHASASGAYGATLSPPVGRSTSPTRPKSPTNRNHASPFQPSGLSQSAGGQLGRGYTDPFPTTLNHLPSTVTTRSPPPKNRRSGSPVNPNHLPMTLSPGTLSAFESLSTPMNGAPRRPGALNGSGRKVSGGVEGPLLPSHSITGTTRATGTGSPSLSTPRASTLNHNSLRSPTLAPPPSSYFPSSSTPASARPTPKPSRPPSVASTSARQSHRRSNSVSSATSGLSRSDEAGSTVGTSRAGSKGGARFSQSPTFEPEAEWPTPEQEAQIGRQREDDEERREVDEREKEAKVQRKILDLEISNKSLLTVNASLERLKLKHTQEIRDLRRKLRESGALGPLLLQRAARVPSEGVPRPPRSHGDEDETDDSEQEGDEEEQTWEEVLEADEAFAAIASRLGALTKRAEEALVWVPRAVEHGRVLTQQEVEDKWAGGSEEGEDESEVEIGSSRGPTGLGIVNRRG